MEANIKHNCRYCEYLEAEKTSVPCSTCSCNPKYKCHFKMSKALENYIEDSRPHTKGEKSIG